MELTLSLQQHLDLAATLHTRLCPRQVIAVRMARLACYQLDLDPAQQRKRMFVFMEVGHCAADAVIAVTGASPTNGLMQLVDYGKVAATFVNLDTRQALRVAEHLHSRDRAIEMMPPTMSPWQAMLEAYQIMADADLLRWERVELIDPLPPLPGPPHRTECERCGDAIHDDLEVLVDGAVLCKPCAHGAYFKPASRPVHR